MAGAVCLTSGGQDSTTCLFWAKQRFAPVLALAFDYGQRHRIELAAARVVCDLAGVPLTVLPLTILRDLGGSALIGSHTELQASGGRGGLPNTFVPGRNLLFLTVAAAFAYQRDIHDLVIGACETDYSGYPDCRQQTMLALAQALHLGMDYAVQIHTPLMHLAKRRRFSWRKKWGRWRRSGTRTRAMRVLSPRAGRVLPVCCAPAVLPKPVWSTRC